MSQDQLALAFEGATVVDLIPDAEMTVFDLAMKAKCFKTERDADRIINAGGFYINYERVSNKDRLIKSNYILPNNVTLLRTGKKTYHLVRWIELQRAKRNDKV